MNPIIVPATAELLERYYGRRPPWTVHRAFAVVHEGEPICVGGAFRHEDRFVAFADVRPIMRERFVKTGVRMARKVMEAYREMGVQLYATADCNVEPAKRFLEHLGFKPLPQPGVYAWQA